MLSSSRARKTQTYKQWSIPKSYPPCAMQSTLGCKWQVGGLVPFSGPSLLSWLALQNFLSGPCPLLTPKLFLEWPRFVWDFQSSWACVEFMVWAFTNVNLEEALVAVWGHGSTELTQWIQEEGVQESPAYVVFSPT